MSRWIESHQSLVAHPKLFKLASLTKMHPDLCIGKLHRLWWWTLQYCENGYLNRYTPEEIGYGIGIEDLDMANMFFEALCVAGWVDKDEMRLHDWWDYAKCFLRVKYKHQPEKLIEIEELWKRKRTVLRTTKSRGYGSSKNPKHNIPNTTQHNTTQPDNGIPFESIISDLNQKAEKNYKHSTKDVQILIRGRWKEGFTLEDFKVVHANMCLKWKNDPKMNQYLRPTTLYQQSKFQGYLNAKIFLSDTGQVSADTEKGMNTMKEWLVDKENENGQ